MMNGTALHADPGTIIPSLKQAPSPSFVSITMAMGRVKHLLTKTMNLLHISDSFSSLV
jgi:hypothetical protein